MPKKPTYDNYGKVVKLQEQPCPSSLIVCCADHIGITEDGKYNCVHVDSLNNYLLSFIKKKYKLNDQQAMDYLEDNYNLVF
ncbi:hypothetical protein SNEBB_004711 [Seison nebaliae]|nr:hypothetical protein SNEBB_004711 [Seison nebaliae]